MQSDGNADDDVLNYVETPLNACSLESFCYPTRSFGSKDTIPLIPLCLGCYQLNESTGKREGRLDLYAVPVSHNETEKNSDHTSSTNEKFAAPSSPPLTIISNIDGAPGVLDGKWSNSGPSSNNPPGLNAFQNYYATAHANGEVWVHSISRKSVAGPDETGEDSNDPSPSDHQKLHCPFHATLAGKSTSPSTNEGLCLALAWENTNNRDDRVNSSFTSRIISSYSDGCTAIHRVTERSFPSSDATEEQPTLELTLEHHWDSHKIFTCPAEVWCANFIDSNIVVTGGDEGSWKIWDLREPLCKPVHHGKDDFDAGVTVLSPHPRRQNLLAIGSYDETIALFDLRRMQTTSNSQQKRPDPLYHSDSLGGGIWRCKWHPFDDDKLLVAAMHGGCVVGEFSGLDTIASENHESTSNASIGFGVQKRFTLHKSMAYGIDWLVHRWDHAVKDRGVEVAASCSFYDKAMYLWKAN